MATAEERAAEVISRLTGARQQLAQRGTCKKCGGGGHLTHECMNMLVTTKTLQQQVCMDDWTIGRSLPSHLTG